MNRNSLKYILPFATRFARGLIAVIVMMTTISWAMAAETLEDGIAAYRSGDFGKAVQVWRALAEQGVPMAQYRLGDMYAEGKGVEQNDKTAMQWYQRAADHGIADAQYNVGASYAAGLGVAQSDADAVKWFRRAADQGMAFAQLNLGLMYASGRGVAQDNVEAMTWLQIALFVLPPGGARSDAARAMQDVADKMTPEQLRQAGASAKRWKAKTEVN
jgi:Sel1 repeat